jgi:ubiquinone biosynthesis protein
MTDVSTDSTPETRMAPPARINWRVICVQLIAYTFAIGVVVWLIPGLRTDFDLSLTDILLISVTYAVLNAVARPAFNLLLMPFLVQTYGSVLLIVDVLVFALLLLIVGSFEASSILAVIIGGLLLGLLRILLETLLGLTPPVVPEQAVRRPPSAVVRFFSFSTGATERLRLLRVRETIMIHGIDAAMDGEGLFSRFRRWMQTWLWKPPVPLVPLSGPVRFRLLLEDLGPTYVKIGQVISSRARTLPVEWQLELEQLQSNVKSYPYEQVSERITDELDGSPEELYAEFDRVPLAAASLAQVHRARLHDGTPVAVKVQRPGIHGQLRSDIRILVRMSDALARRARWAREVDLTGMIIEFGTGLMRELDYTVEAYNARRLSRVLEPIDGVRVPDVHYELSSSGVLTLEFVDGVKSTNSAAIEAAGLDREVLADSMIRASIKMMLIDGFFHADPHPGNVFVDLTTGEMTLLDTGMIGELAFQQRVRLASMFLVVRNGDVRGLAQTLKSLSTPYRETDDERFYRDFEQTLTPYLDPPPGEKIDIAGKVLPMGMDILREAGYRIEPGFTLAIKATTQAEAISSSLVPTWTGTEFMSRSFDAILDLLPETFTSDAVEGTLTRQAGFVVREAMQQLPSLQDGALKWIEYLKKGGLKVELDTSGLDIQLQSLKGTARMVTLGILVVGLVVGSALAAGIGGLEDSALEPVTGIAAVVFTVSATIGGIAIVMLSLQLYRQYREGRRSEHRSLDRL